ncbi:MAG: VacJ family lipoprotein [Alphaproteobacteria bacterium]|nr:VacJ family lipoprotein [Alphaproteobacteria bacterium]
MTDTTRKCDTGWMAALRPMGLRFGVVVLAGFLVTACAATPDPKDPDAVAEYNEVNDPIEPVNRAIFEFNRGLDTLFLRPAATLYKGLVPPPIQNLVHNFLNNLKTPVVLLNDLLQGEGGRAANTATRFAINTTVGVLGFGDPASDMGYARHGEDFGQTLGVWGLGEGPYIVLPVLGPSNPRDTVGKVVDHLTDPVNRWARNTDRDSLPLTRFVAEAIDFRALNMAEIDDLERTSIDYYAAVRSLYRQVRSDEINNGDTSGKGLPQMGHMDGYDLGPMDEPGAEAPALATKR